jgi:hypothetical protein
MVGKIIKRKRNTVVCARLVHPFSHVRRVESEFSWVQTTFSAMLVTLVFCRNRERGENIIKEEVFVYPFKHTREFCVAPKSDVN